jgi:hypothetical protein
MTSTTFYYTNGSSTISNDTTLEDSSRNLSLVLLSVDIGTVVTSLGESCFLECSTLSEVIIPNSVITISGFCFKNCYGMTKIIIPNSVNSYR